MIYQIDILARPRTAGAHRRARVGVWRAPARCGRCGWFRWRDHRRRRLVAANRPRRVPPIRLDLGDAPYAGVPCWTGRAQRWARSPLRWPMRPATHTDVRPLMPGNPISLKALVRVAEARAGYADHGTGRDSRPTNERLAADTGYSVRTVQRADTVAAPAGGGHRGAARPATHPRRAVRVLAGGGSWPRLGQSCGRCTTTRSSTGSSTSLARCHPTPKGLP